MENLSFSANCMQSLDLSYASQVCLALYIRTWGKPHFGAQFYQRECNTSILQFYESNDINRVLLFQLYANFGQQTAGMMFAKQNKM